MKNLVLPLFAVLLFAACQNSTTTPEAQTQDTPTEVKIDLVQLKEAAVKAKTGLQDMNSFMEEINSANLTLTEPQKVELEGIRSQLNDVMGKQEQMVKGLELGENTGGAASSALNTPEVPTATVLQDYIESVSNYESFLQDLKNQLEAIKSGKGKQ